MATTTLQRKDFHSTLYGFRIPEQTTKKGTQSIGRKSNTKIV